MKKLFFLMSYVVIVIITTTKSFAETHQVTLCSGDSIQIGYEAQNGAIYIWNTNPVQYTKIIWVKPIIENTYIVSVWDQFQNPLGKDTFDVKVLPAPNVSISFYPGQIICLGKSVILTANYGEDHYVWSDGQIININSTIVTPSITSTYTVTVTGTNGCTTIGKTVVIVTPLPTAFNLSTTNNPFCEGGSGATITLSGSEIGVSYQLKLNGTNIGAPKTGTGTLLTFTGTSAGTYTIEGNSTAGCTNMMTGNVTLTVNPLPGNATAITGPNTVCEGTNATFFTNAISNATTYTWSVPIGSTIISNTGTSITVKFGAQSGNVSVAGYNACGGGQAFILPVTVNVMPTLNVTANPTNICAGASTQLTANTNANVFVWNTGAVTQTITVTPSVTTTYYVTVTGSTTCSTAGNVHVIVYPLPNVTLNLSPTAACQSTYVVTLTGGSPAGGTYIGGCVYGNDQVFPAANAVNTYPIIYSYTDAFGCKNTSSAVNFTVNPVPAVLFINVLGVVTRENNPIDLSSYVVPKPDFPSSGSGIFSGPGMYGTWFSPATAGIGTHMITYTYTDPITGCSASQIQYITVGSPEGINEVMYAVNAITLYPNPTARQLNLKGIDTKEIKHIKIVNLIGDVMYMTASHPDLMIDVSGFSNGVYFISFINNDGLSISKRFMKQ